MTTSIFETKEQYLSFRAAWKSASNDIKTKSQLKETTYGKYRESGWLNAEHYILLNILRGKPADSGFTPVTNSNKLLKSGMHINHGFYYGMNNLRNMQKIAGNVKNSKVSEHVQNRLTDFLAPFNNTVTADMLISIILPKVEPLYSTYGKSKQVASKIVNGDFKPTNFKQVLAALEEVA